MSNTPSTFEIGFSSKYLDFLSSSTNAHILTSCGENQISHKFPNSVNRLFTSLLLKGIKGEACLRGNSLIYLADLFYFIEHKMKESVKDQTPQLYPQPGRNDLALCFVHKVKPIELPDKAKELIVDGPDERPVNHKIRAIRESIIKSPIEGAAHLSEYLAGRDPDLRNRVDLYRSELLRIKSDYDKYDALDPSLEVQRHRCIFHLLEICHQQSDT